MDHLFLYYQVILFLLCIHLDQDLIMFSFVTAPLHIAYRADTDIHRAVASQQLVVRRHNCSLYFPSEIIFLRQTHDQ